MTVSLRLASEAEKPAYWEMLAAYLVEDYAISDPEGKFDPLDFPNFPKYWIEPLRKPWWILKGGEPAGLALVNKYSWSGERVDYGLIEYYVSPEHRRAGIGREAARQLFTAWPGQWELACHNLNARSQAFWDATIAATPHRDWRRVERDEDRLHRFVTG